MSSPVANTPSSGPTEPLADPLARLGRPALLPGLDVVRRDDRHLQVGLHGPHRVVLEDRPRVRAALDALADARTPGVLDRPTAAALLALVAAGLVVDRDDVDGLDPALVARHGPEAPAVLRRRASVPVEVRGPLRLRRALGRLLHGTGVPLVDPERDPGHDPGLVVLLATGTVDRDALDACTRDGLTHLVAEVDAHHGRVGPLVEPGRTACLRCVDAHEAESEPGRPLLLAQVGSAERDRPVDAGLEAMVLGWAARDLLTHLDGGRGSTWSATVDLGGTMPERTSWHRHPCCGCAWDADLVLGP